MWFDNYILAHVAVSWKTHGTKRVVSIHLYKAQHMFITIHPIGVTCLKHNSYSIGHYSGARVKICETARSGRFPQIQSHIIITIVQSYTGKYYKFVAVCIVTSVQHK